MKKRTYSIDWLRASLPVIVVVTAMGTVFKEAVVESIQSTPNPELVYLIFGAFFLAIALSWAALYSYKREEATLTRWQGLDAENRLSFIESLRSPPDLQRVYEIIEKKSTAAQNARQSALSLELSDFEKRLSARLILPSYLGGALIGLGLIGTFIGLLGTLSELSSLFSVLSRSPENASISQVEMFQDMIQRLQGPMSGMGTAFVTSLYGLVGSMIVGLVIMNVRKVGTNLAVSAKRYVRLHEITSSSDLDTSLLAEKERAINEARQWQLLFEEARDQRKVIFDVIPQLRNENRSILSAVADLTTVLLERNSATEQMLGVIKDTGANIARTGVIQESIIRHINDNRSEMAPIVRFAEVLNRSLIEKVDGIDLVERITEKFLLLEDVIQDTRSENQRIRRLLEQESDRVHKRDEEDRIGFQQVVDLMLQLDGVLKGILLEARQDSRQGAADQREFTQAIRSCTQSLDDLSARLRHGSKRGDQ